MEKKNIFQQIGHWTSYSVWLAGQIVKESTIMAYDTFTTGRHIAPVMIYYPLRLTSERDIAIFIASITMTPGTLALGVTGPKEVDEDANASKRNLSDVSSVATSEFRTHGLTRVQRFLAVHAMYGADPQELLHSLAVMEAKISPSVRKRKIEFDVEHLVERGVPGPRGYRGNRGGRASEDGVFDIEKVDSTPHAAAFVAAIMRQDDNLDVNDFDNLSREEREKIAKTHARKAAEEKRRRIEDEEKRRRRKLAEELSPPALDLDDADDDAKDSEGGIDPARVAPSQDGGISAMSEAHDQSPTADGTKASRSGRRTSPIASLVNALEVRSRLPQPNLDLSGRRGLPGTPLSRLRGRHGSPATGQEPHTGDQDTPPADGDKREDDSK
ncbi:MULTISPECIES: Na+/H+ antiporter subunit E [unclassified Corynebacterium]|uniref:Na+/H+ antiporter subunit E n=1 Tax=unclassified Corynebacterium TaxID=2624378 RepID=UPI004033BA4A